MARPYVDPRRASRRRQLMALVAVLIAFWLGVIAGAYWNEGAHARLRAQSRAAAPLTEEQRQAAWQLLVDDMRRREEQQHQVQPGQDGGR